MQPSKFVVNHPTEVTVTVHAVVDKFSLYFQNNLHWKCMNFYGLFYIVVYEAIKINHCTPSDHLNSVLHFWFWHKLSFFL